MPHLVKNHAYTIIVVARARSLARSQKTKSKVTEGLFARPGRSGPESFHGPQLA